MIYIIPVDYPKLRLNGHLKIEASSEEAAERLANKHICKLIEENKVKYEPKPWENDPVGWEREHY